MALSLSEPKQTTRSEASFCGVIEGGEVCGRPTHCKSLCWKHYRRQWETGSVFKQPRPPRPPRAPRPRKPCEVAEGGETCGKPMVARGLCMTHYKRLRRTGTVEERPRARTVRIPAVLDRDLSTAAVSYGLDVDEVVVSGIRRELEAMKDARS